MHISDIEKKLKIAISEALCELSAGEANCKLPKELSIEIGIPKDQRHGDLTTNVALRLAKNFSKPGIWIATNLKDKLLKDGKLKDKKLSLCIEEAHVSPPGFINFRFSKKYLNDILHTINTEKKLFGKSNLGASSKVNIEFVSANPTGPLTIAHGRQAAVGDSLSRILRFAGFKVLNEYFINDVGTQIELLGKSIHARYLELNGVESSFPEDGYHGEYIKKIAENLNKKYGKKLLKQNENNLDKVSKFGADYILNTIKDDLGKFGVIFNNWFSQKALSPKVINATLNKVKEKGFVYEKEGATWFKSTTFGDDKDRVVIKSDGKFTYLAPDIAYHLNKYKRKFDKIIDIWGPDHHGYIPRLKASVQALGYNKESISILIVQLATLYRGGVALSMSTRKGEFITLKEVINEVGCDVAKFFFLMRKLDSHLDFDLELAKKTSMDNPVYYIQYAHARITSIFGFSNQIANNIKKVKLDCNLLDKPEETLLLRILSRFPLMVEASANTLEPYRIVEYLNELAKAFHSFYTKHRVVSEDNMPLTKARLELANGVKNVLANGLNLLGVSLPERM